MTADWKHDARYAGHDYITKDSDWQKVPRGFFALPVARDPERVTGGATTLGWKLFERKEPRTYKTTGKVVGRHAWMRHWMLDPGVGDARLNPAAWQELRDKIDDTPDGRKADIAEILADVDNAQARFGQLTGRCGCCGRKLTDANSKMRGIGPECNKFIRFSPEVSYE